MDSQNIDFIDWESLLDTEFINEIIFTDDFNLKGRSRSGSRYYDYLSN